MGLAGGIGYVGFDGEGLTDPTVANADTVLWLTLTQDCSSAMTGSSVFDFDGDGFAEVVYADELLLHIYDGTTGAVLFETCNTSGTLWEYPLVADGTIPTVELANCLQPGLNNFRQNVQPTGQFAAPDLIVSVFPRCSSPNGLVARVFNVGEASVGAGVVVGFYEGDPAAGGVWLGEATTTQTLYSLGSEDVFLALPTTPVALVYVVVDDGNPPHPWHECRSDNNTSTGVDPGSCIPE